MSTSQQGYALLVFVAILLAAMCTLAVKAMEHAQPARNRITAAALAEAKEALIGYAGSYKETHLHVPFYMNGYLPNPDMGPGNSLEGITSGSFSGNGTDRSVIGKLPWKTLKIPPLRDGQNECLWYIVSGRFKNNPPTDALNWDTQGQINVLDANGNRIASNLVALLVAVGPALDGQNRTLIDASHSQCGGNYDARNYLDAYNVTDALLGEVNYFSGTSNNSRAGGDNNKNFILASSAHYNDQMAFITVQDLFRSIVHRSDFYNQINALLNDSSFIDALGKVAISSGKGTSNVDCNSVGNADNRTFCNNWKEMLLLTQLSAPAPITIDGSATPACKRVLIFGGQKTATQIRISGSDKALPANYLEGSNLASFATPVAVGNNFNGAYSFNASTPSADLVRCIP